MTQSLLNTDDEPRAAIVDELTWSEAHQAAHVARAAPGVTLVDNQLTVIR